MMSRVFASKLCFQISIISLRFYHLVSEPSCLKKNKYKHLSTTSMTYNPTSKTFEKELARYVHGVSEVVRIVTQLVTVTLPIL